jgi:glutathione S-transferase
MTYPPHFVARQSRSGAAAAPAESRFGANADMRLAMALILHAHPLSSYCWKVLTALYESGADFELRLVDFGDPENEAAFRKLWPIAKFPVLEDGARTIVESTTIIEYLALRHRGAEPLIPQDPEAALEVRMLDRIFDNYVMTPMQKIVFNRFCPPEARNAWEVEAARRLIETACGWLEQEISGRQWAAGDDFSLADCAAAPSLHYADKVQPLRERFAVLGRYLDRLEARPSFARVLEEAKPYAHMFPEG